MGIDYRKALNFDLDTNALKQHYPGKNYRQAYRDVKKFLLENGFKHRQWSGYTSIKPMADSTMRAKVLKLKKAFPWLSKCVNRFDVTDIGEQHDLTHIITGKAKVNVKEKVNDRSEQTQEKNNKAFFSVAMLKREAERIRKQPHRSNVKNKSKDIEL